MSVSPMSSRRRARATLVLVLAASLVGSVGLAAAPPSSAAPPSGTAPESVRLRHAGTVVAVEPGANQLVVEEMSPGNDLRRIIVQIEPMTSLVEIGREPQEVVVRRDPGIVESVSTYRYVERSLSLATVKPGDFVVVVLDRPLAGGRPIPARRVELTARAAASAGPAAPPAR